MAAKPKYLCVFCDGQTTYDEPFCPTCERDLSVELLHRHERKVGEVRVNFTVGRIHPKKGK